MHSEQLDAMNEKIVYILDRIEWLHSQGELVVLEGDELLEQEDLFFHEALLIQVLKKHNTTILSQIFLLSYLKFLRAFNLDHWENVFEAIADNQYALKRLLYFSYHYIKVDFFKTFSKNEYLNKLLKAEYHLNPQLYNKLNPTVKRELEIGNLNPSDFEYIQEKLILQGAVRVSAKEGTLEIITDDFLDKLYKKDEEGQLKELPPDI